MAPVSGFGAGDAIGLEGQQVTSAVYATNTHTPAGWVNTMATAWADDPAGDQFVINFNDGVKQAWPAKTYGYSGTLTTGSGKYAGITGTVKGECHAGDFRPVSAETYLDYCAPEGNYKLP